MLHYEVIDCPYCDGTGIVDCCDGDKAQPEWQPGPLKDSWFKWEKPIPLEDDYVLKGSPEAIENFKRLAGLKSDDGS